MQNNEISLFDGLNTNLTNQSNNYSIHSNFTHIKYLDISQIDELDEIKYSFQNSIFGDFIVASYLNKIVYLAFVDEQNIAFLQFDEYFKKSRKLAQIEESHLLAKELINHASNNNQKLDLLVYSTEFQKRVWEQLLQIPLGKTQTYMQIANQLNNPKAIRAVATAIGKNPIAYLIPCHRVVQTNGSLGGYMWGLDRKKKILSWEQAYTL